MQAPENPYLQQVGPGGNPDKDGVLLRCIQCGADFVWTEGEQRFFARKGFATPRRCQRCREERKQHGTYGVQVVSVDSASGLVLCRVCRHPASRSASLRLGEAICSGCACGNTNIPTEDADRLEYAEWEAHFNNKGGSEPPMHADERR